MSTTRPLPAHYTRAPFAKGARVTLHPREPMPPDGTFTRGRVYTVEGLDEGETGDMLGLHDDSGELGWFVWEHFTAEETATP